MSDCKIYPADTVDIYGHVWPSVGENIRNGLFGENVKVGYVNINEGEIITTDFIISSYNHNSFIIKNINFLLVFLLNINKGGSTITFFNAETDATIISSTEFSKFNGTIKIIYKELI